ncbi:MAG: tetratricopeptide repeat-containing sensor histidine kinase, partial [Candidatus Promineifilaceae bacterium]
VSIAKLYYEQELLQLATDYAQKAVELGRSLESNRRLLAQIHNLLGVLAKSQGNRDRAFAHYGEALKLRQLIEDEQGLADTNHNIGILYEENNELKDALHYYSQALALRRELKDQQGLVRSFVVLGTAHRKLQQHDLASNYLHRALELAQQLRHYNLESNIQYELAELDAERGDYEQAFFHQRRHTELRRFLFSETRSAQIAHAQTKFEAFRELQQDEVTRLCSEEIEQRIEERIRPIIRSMETSQDEANEAKHTLSETKEISMLKTQLMRAVSHELRTPLAVVANASYILERFNKRLEASKREANFARIKESIVYMKELLDEIAWVDASVLTHLSVAPELIGIPALRERIVSGLSISLLDRGRLLVTTPDVDDVVKLDVGMVQQAVNQLISNAMKFSREPSGDDPMVELDINYLAGEMVITVSDYGVGIPFEDQAGIGIPFARANNVNGVRGLGLGLSIVKKLVEAMDGRFAIESKGAGKGCQTMVALPCSELNSAEARHLQINPRVIA